ncbi:MAG: MBL fold metallo-hydrolase [Chitinophagales bacterium]
MIEVYASEFTIGRLKAEYPYIFDKNYPGVPLIDLQLIENKKFKVKSLDVLPIAGKHGEIPVLGFRFGSFTYVTDVNFISDEELDKIKGSEVFVINALHHRKHHSHFTLEEALEIAKKVKAKKTYFIHMSHFMGKHEAVEASLPNNVFFSYDGLIINL